MLGKLKEACNKFIVNKFPKSVINYRNVADYVVKKTDVEVFATALLLQTDIWIYRSEVGNKWMVFSGRGDKLIDTCSKLIDTCSTVFSGRGDKLIDTISPSKYCRLYL